MIQFLKFNLLFSNTWKLWARTWTYWCLQWRGYTPKSTQIVRTLLPLPPRVCVTITSALAGTPVASSTVVVKTLLGAMSATDVESRPVEDFYPMTLWWTKNIIAFGMIFEIVKYKNVFHFDWYARRFTSYQESWNLNIWHLFFDTSTSVSTSPHA